MPSPSSSSQSSHISNNSESQQQPQLSQQSRPRIRTDSFFGIDTIEQSSHPINNTHLHSGAHLQPLDLNQPVPANPIDDPNLRPSSFYGLQVDPNVERSQGQTSPHLRSSGANSPASSLPPDSTDQHRTRQINSQSLAPSSQRRQSNRLSSIPHPQDGVVLDPNNPNALSAGPLLDHSHLKPGSKAKLLNHAKSLSPWMLVRYSYH